MSTPSSRLAFVRREPRVFTDDVDLSLKSRSKRDLGSLEHIEGSRTPTLEAIDPCFAM